jgi:2'-hydroxyisoflavone reductase
MHVLLLGGTLFLGRHIVEAALDRGHRVTLFNRGKSGPGLYPRAESLRGDRNGDLTALEGRSFDAVVDTCGYVPRIVRRTAQVLGGRISHYTFISSMSVYPGSAPGSDETAPLATLEDPASEDVRQHYGALKALCERTLDELLPGRVLHARAGLIVGPYDHIYRFSYWLERVAAGGAVLAPGTPDAPLQLIHARDLAEWVLDKAQDGTAGPFNVTGPERPLRFGGFLDAVREVVGGDTRWVWADDAFLNAQSVQPMDGLPLWIPAESRGFFLRSIDRALAAGLKFRPLSDTIRQTWDWLQREGFPTGGIGILELESGLPPEREQELLAALEARTGPRSG